MGKNDQRQKALSKKKTKIRILAVAKMLNEGRKLTTEEILRRLDLQYGIQADKKTIYKDVSSIDKVMPIQIMPGRCGGYKKQNEVEEITENTCPCDRCVKVPNPSNCENKNCKAWKEWWLKRWEALRNGR